MNAFRRKHVVYKIIPVFTLRGAKLQTGPTKFPEFRLKKILFKNHHHAERERLSTSKDCPK